MNPTDAPPIRSESDLSSEGKIVVGQDEERNTLPPEGLEDIPDPDAHLSPEERAAIVSHRSQYLLVKSPNKRSYWI